MRRWDYRLESNPWGGAYLGEGWNPSQHEIDAAETSSAAYLMGRESGGALKVQCHLSSWLERVRSAIRPSSRDNVANVKFYTRPPSASSLNTVFCAECNWRMWQFVHLPTFTDFYSSTSTHLYYTVYQIQEEEYHLWQTFNIPKFPKKVACLLCVKVLTLHCQTHSSK